MPVIATIALGVGATTTIFSVLDCVVFRSLPYPNSDELVFFEDPAHSSPLFVDWRDQTTSFSAVAGGWDDDFDLAGDDRPLRVHGARVTPGFLEMFGATPARGRLFQDNDYAGPPSTAIVSHRLWQSRWGADPSLVGRTITVDGHPLSVVGILGQEFELPQAGFSTFLDVLVPLDISAPRLQLQTAQAELDVLSASLAGEYPDHHQLRDGSPRLYAIVPLLDAMVGDVRGPLYLLSGAVMFLLLIACVNVANMFLARGSDRNHEMAVRVAMGAKRKRVVAQLLTESITISVVGGLAGVVLAMLGVELIKLLEPGQLPRVDAITVDQRVLWFALALSVFTGVLFGLAPAVQAIRVGVGDTLKSAARAATVGRRKFKLREALVISEIAIAFILLVGAGLLFNSFVRLMNVDPGFNPDNLVTMRLTLGPTFTEADRSIFARDLEERLDAIPGIEGTAIGTTLPFYSHTGTMCCWMGGVDPEHEPDPDAPWTTIHLVSPEYFRVLEAPVLQGRVLSAADDSGSAVAVVNAELAGRMFGEDDPVGKTLYVRNLQFTVVGVVNDVKHWGLTPSLSQGDPRGHHVYLPHRVFAGRFPRMAVALRTPLELATLAPELREAVWGLRPDLPLTEVTTMQARITRSTADRRFFTTILVLFAVVASLLASLGIYGSMLYSVRQRRRELGIRLALGAQQGGVIAMVIRRGMTLTAVGIGLGLAGGWALSRILESALYGITTHDALTYVAVVLLLATVAFVACYLPAYRAASVDPTETLRTE
jgi:predicted permease